MKKLIFMLIGLWLTFSAYSQIEKLHTFNSWVDAFLVDGEMFYAQYDTSSVYIYNDDFSLYKDIFIADSLSIREVKFLSRNLFSLTGDLEFAVVSVGKNDSYFQYFFVLNEFGDVLIEESMYAVPFYMTFLFSYIIEDKLVLDYSNEVYYEENDSTAKINSTSIFKLPGVLSNAQSGFKSSGDYSETSAFPNPASEHIYLRYSLDPGQTDIIRIYSNSGQLIDTKQIGYHMEALNLDVSHYPSGMYIYRYSNGSNSFIVK